MRIVHFSDWHWSFDKLPEADLYVCTGDMYDDYLLRFTEASPYPFGEPRKYSAPDAQYGREMQERAAARLAANGGFARYLGSPDAPVLALRGNHDFADLAPLFSGCNLLHEFVNNELVNVAGMTFTGHRGIPYIRGFWSNETLRGPLLDEHVRTMPEADVYLTHYAPAGIGLSNGYGLEGVAEHLGERHIEDGPATHLHLFGHIHERGGRTRYCGPVLHVNSARTFTVLEGDRSGWRDIT